MTADGATAYGGVRLCVLKKTELLIELRERTARKLGHGGFRLKLDVDAASVDKLREGLARIFSDYKDRAARLLL